MAKPKSTPVEQSTPATAAAQPPVDNDHVAPGCEPFSPEVVEMNRPPQGLTPRYFDTGTRADFHRHHFGRQGVPNVRRIDPASLKTAEGWDPWLRFSNGTVMQVRADHAAELLECDDLTGGESRYQLATDAEIEAEKARMQASLRR